MNDDAKIAATPAPGSALAGALLVLPLHLLQIPLLVASGVLAEAMGVRGESQMAWILYPVVGIGLSQWLYLGPAIWFARHRGVPRTAAGLAIGGGITLLLNSACFGMLWF